MSSFISDRLPSAAALLSFTGGRGRARLLPAAIFALALAVPVASAHASTVSTLTDELRYVAGPGEVNDVTVTTLTAPRTVPVYRVSDPGANIEAGDGCVSMDAHNARCVVAPPGPAGPGVLVSIGTGDLDDRADVAGLQPPVFGREHNHLCGGTGNDVLEGSDAHDHLLGGPGDDVLNARASDDVIQGDGGGGLPECFIDGPGPSGNDTIFGGAGPDSILAQDGLADQVFCGPDVENVTNVDAVDTVADDCERVNIAP